MKGSFIQELVATLGLLIITAVKPFLIPTRKQQQQKILELLASCSRELRRLIWKITEQEVSGIDEQEEIMCYADSKTGRIIQLLFPRHYWQL